jgi:hypothetical protein
VARVELAEYFNAFANTFQALLVSYAAWQLRRLRQGLREVISEQKEQRP